MQFFGQGKPPVGVVFDRSGSLLVSSDTDGHLYRFGSGGGVVSDSTQLREVSGVDHALAYSKDGGNTWSAAIQATTDRLDVPHIMEVAGGPSGVAYVSWLSNSDPRGYALFLRTFSISRGWLSDPFQVSTQFGDPSVWPGDTTGINTLGTAQVVLSWGSATDAKNKKSDIFATVVTARTR